MIKFIVPQAKKDLNKRKIANKKSYNNNLICQVSNLT